MKDDQTALDSLAEAIEHSISIIESGIKAYVFERDLSSYRQVSTELRKLLTDRNAARSFAKSISQAKNANNVLEVFYGNGKRIFLKSFVNGKPDSSDSYGDVTPNIYRIPEDILYSATHGDHRVTLRDWLVEDLTHDRSGRVLNVGTVIKHIADREGSHIINPSGDQREDIAIAFFNKQPSAAVIEDTDFNRWNPWRQFIIDAGMRLLDAKFKSGIGLIEHNIDIPAMQRDESTLRLQKRMRQ